MAWIFSLSAECGPQKEAARAVARHFDKFVVTLGDGTSITCNGETFYDGQNWWACVCPMGVTTTGIREEQDREQLTQIGSALYERLRTAPAFRYALFGVELNGFVYYKELDENIVTGGRKGLVLSETAWRHFGSPEIFVPFAPGYRWQPFIEAI